MTQPNEGAPTMSDTNTARYGKYSAHWETITPEVAHELITGNTHNRNLRARPVAAYSRDMVRGLWEVNGETIKIAEDGTLNDGQHRLAACIESGVPFVSLVVRGLPVKAQDNVDVGARRSYSDVLRLRGELNSTEVAATIRLISQWERSPSAIGSGNIAPTNAEMDQVLERFPWIRESVTTISRASRETGLPKSVAGLTWWAFMLLDPDDCEHFFARLIDGQNLAEGNPIYALRRALANIDEGARGTKNVRYHAAIVIKAWNAYRAGDECKVLTFRPGGSRPESFPFPK